MTNMRRRAGIGLWDEQDEFYYDVLNLPDGTRVPLRVRSMVGLIPLCAVEVLDGDVLASFPGFAARAGVDADASARSRRRWSRAGASRARTTASCCRCCAATA